MPRPLVIGAHKLFMTLEAAIAFARHLRQEFGAESLRVEPVISPSVINLAHVAAVLADAEIGIAAQTFHQEQRGAHTGQVSLEELAQLGCRYVILGHRELAAAAAETPAALGAKLAACLRRRVAPIVFCPDLPESPRELRNAATRYVAAFLSEAVRDGLSVGDVVIAYEPARPPKTDDIFDSDEWSVTTSRSIAALRWSLQTVFGDAAASVRLVYGGGASESTISRLMREFDINGVLIGRASTDAASFVRILQEADRAAKAAFRSAAAESTLGNEI